MGDVNLPLGATNSGTNDWSDVHGEDQAIVDVVNGGIDNDNISGTASIAVSKLASPTGDVTWSGSTTAIGAGKVTAAMLAASTQSAYRTLLFAQVPFDDSRNAGTYQFVYATTPAAAAGNPVLSGSSTLLTETADVVYTSPRYIYFDDADYTVASLTQKLRVRAQVACNATAPGTITFTVGLYPITVAGGTDTLTFTLGTVVSGSTTALVNPSASSIAQANSGDFTIPADGAYAFGVVTSAQTAANSVSLLSAQLQQRSV